MQSERRIAVRTEVFDVCPDPAQRVHEIANRALVHPRRAGKAVFAAAHHQRGGERPQRGAGIAEEELGFFNRERAAHAPDALLRGSNPQL